MPILTGYIHVVPASVDAFTADIEALAPVTRAREGCLLYAVVPDDPSAGRMLVIERWRDQAALSNRLRASGTVVFVERRKGRMVAVLKYDASNERVLDVE